MKRYPAVAGQFYAGSRERLLKEIEDCFLSHIGPGAVPKMAASASPASSASTTSSHTKREIKGAVVPHAGLIYSGPVAAHAYSAIAADGFPETFVIIGPNHTGYGTAVSVAMDDFITPLGEVKIDSELAGKIAHDIVDIDSSSHRNEHSIEVQLPFLQYLKPDIRFVPVCMMVQDYDMAERVGSVIRDAVKGRDVVVIASTDFSHYVRPNVAAKLDRMAIDAILELNPVKFYRVVQKHNISMCGYGPVMAMLSAVGGTKAELLKYATSGDVSPMNEVVGYAAIVVK